MRWLFAGLWFAAFAAAKSVTGYRLLIVFDSYDSRNEYTMLLTDLSARGFDITIKDPRADVALFEFGERLFDHALVAPEMIKGLGPGLTPQNLLAFVNEGGNLLLATTSSVPESLRDLARELGIDIAPKDTAVVDHFAYDRNLSSERHEVILAESPRGPVLYTGTCHSLRESPMLDYALRGGRTSYSYDTKEEGNAAEDPWVAGTQLFLVSRFQALNNARITVAGSLKMFSDGYFEASTISRDGQKQRSANRDFVGDITKWTFQEAGVVRANDIHHHLKDHSLAEELDPSIYRIKTDLTYSAELSLYENDHWGPVLLPDVQLEFTMLDPYYRVTLKPSSTEANSTIYDTTFQIPDQHGVFTLNLEYRRPGLSYIHEKRAVTVRHFAHDEFPRSYAISSAWPWMAAVFSVSFGWIAFCALWLFDKDRASNSGAKKTQ